MADQPTTTHPTTMQTSLESSIASEGTAYPTPIVITERLIIRPMYLPDAPSMALHANDLLVSQYMSLGFPSPYTISSAEAWINMNNALHTKRLLFDVNAHTGEVGYWIAQAHWGKGYMPEALQGFTKWVFENWDRNGQRLTRIWGYVFSGNFGSMRCFEKSGYAPEGVMKGHCQKNGKVMDVHLFGLTKPDWEKRMVEVSGK
ncbi:acyl-CoA N-acyltransferase [Bipolaris maydis]|nr:acyl-CoA N-acyltransferase [Bipolaris maydis]